MNREHLTAMIKIEVVVTGSDSTAVRGLFRATGAAGYTGVSGVSGFGHDGEHPGRLLFNDNENLTLLITVVPENRADALIAGLETLLAGTSGVMFVSDTFVSRPQYFQ
ncbi:MAG: DUF190 domain-containing protein [Lacisediminihabitans sp.]